MLTTPSPYRQNASLDPIIFGSCSSVCFSGFTWFLLPIIIEEAGFQLASGSWSIRSGQPRPFFRLLVLLEAVWLARRRLFATPSAILPPSFQSLAYLRCMG